jgi:hypothetical protein
MPKVVIVFVRLEDGHGRFGVMALVELTPALLNDGLCWKRENSVARSCMIGVVSVIVGESRVVD